MVDQLLWRALLALLFIAFIAHRGYYHRKGSQPDLGAPGDGSHSVAAYAANLLALLGLVSVVIYIFSPHTLSWSSLPFPSLLRWTGVALALAGFALLQWSHWALGGNWCDTPRISP